MKKFITVLAIIAAVLSTDLHWGVMQTMTWAKMVHQSESDADFFEKIVFTVTGEAPCDHCRALAEEKGAERNEILSLLGKGPQLAPVDGSVFQLKHQRCSLFALVSDEAPDCLGSPEGIDHPPRV